MRARKGRTVGEGLGPRFWAIINDRTPNPLADNGKCTDAGRRFLERTETLTLVSWRGLAKTERTLNRKEWTELWLKGNKQIDQWVTEQRKIAARGI